MSQSDRHLQLELNAVKLLRSLLLEVTDDPQAIADTVEGETSIKEAIHGVLKDMQEDGILLEGLEKTIATLRERHSRLILRQDKRFQAIQKAMELAEISKPLVYPEATVSLRRVPPKLIVEDESKIPPQYFDPQEPKLNKARLIEDIKTGKSIEGAAMSNGGQTISIRRS